MIVSPEAPDSITQIFAYAIQDLMPQTLRPIPFAAFVFAGVAGAQTVSYSRDIAPILAMHCHLCHGANPESAAGGLSTRTWADLKRGGNLGAVVVPGNPVQSPLLQFIDGSRGEAHRMPLGGRPLTQAQIASIERWIREGAADDGGTTQTYRLELPSVAFNGNRPVRISCLLPVAGYMELELSDDHGRVLYLDGGAVKPARDVASLTTTGQWFSWTLRRAPEWPTSVRVHLTISYAVEEPKGAILAALEGRGGDPPMFPAGEARVRVVSLPSGNMVSEERAHLSGGMPDHRRWMSGMRAGWYAVQFHYETARSDIATLVRVTPPAQ